MRVRVGVVQRNKLLRFDFGVDDQPVGLVDHLLLTDRAQRRFGRVAVGQRGVLHRGQGVRGVHERHRPSIPRQPADLARQPVMRMHDVVVPGLVRGLGAQHARGERAQLGGQVVLVQALERPGHDVADQHAGRDLHDGLIGRRRRAGEDLHLDAAAGHLQRALQHVDVHPAGVAGTGLGQRRRVHRQHGYSSRNRKPRIDRADPWLGAHRHVYTVAQARGCYAVTSGRRLSARRIAPIGSA